jgi:hypothetical protein
MRWERHLRPRYIAHVVAPHHSQLIQSESSSNSSRMNTSNTGLPIMPFGMNTCAESPHPRPIFTPKIVAKSSAMNTSKNSPVTHFRMNTYRQTTPATTFRMNTYVKRGRGEGSYCYLNCYPSKPAQPPARRTAPAPVRRIAHRYPMAPFSFTVSGVSNAQGRIPQDCARSGGFFL